MYWRPRASDGSLTRIGRVWTLSTVAHTLPFIGAAILLVVLKPLTFPVGLIALAHAWMIPELYAARGANVVRERPAAQETAERAARSLLCDLVGHRARALHARTGLIVQSGCAIRRAWRMARRPGRSSARAARGTAGSLLLREGDRTLAAVQRSDRASAARAASRRNGVRHGGEPGVLRGTMAAAPPAAGTGPGRARCRRGSLASNVRLRAAPAGVMAAGQSWAPAPDGPRGPQGACARSKFVRRANAVSLCSGHHARHDPSKHVLKAAPDGRPAPW